MSSVLLTYQSSMGIITFYECTYNLITIIKIGITLEKESSYGIEIEFFNSHYD